MKTYTGIDYHKRYSVACTLDAQGNKLQEAKIDDLWTGSNRASHFGAEISNPTQLVLETDPAIGPHTARAKTDKSRRCAGSTSAPLQACSPLKSEKRGLTLSGHAESYRWGSWK